MEYKRPPRFWQANMYKGRTNNEIMHILKSQEISGHSKNFTRMSSVEFEYLLNLVSPIIKKKDTRLRKALTSQDKLALN